MQISGFSPNTGKYGPEKTLYLDTFHTVLNVLLDVDFSGWRVKAYCFAIAFVIFVFFSFIFSTTNLDELAKVISVFYTYCYPECV